MKRHPLALLPLALLLVFGGCSNGLGERLRDAAADAAADATEREVRDRTRRTVHGAFDVAEDAVRCAVTDQTCIEQAQAQGRPVAVTDADGNVVRQIPAGAEAGAGGVGTVNANYDFAPGERTLFAEDFTSDNVGDFPRGLEFQGGSMEVVVWQGGRALRANTPGQFDVTLPETLPEQFTMSFDFYTPDFVNSMLVYPVDAEGERVGSHHLSVNPYGDAVGIAANERGGISSMGNARDMLLSAMTPIRLMADGSYIKVFAGTERMANIPNADWGRTRTIRFDFNDVRDQPAYLSNIRIAAGGRDLYSALEAEGRATAEGILFDTGSATIQPASADVLAEIGTMLAEHPGLRLLIEGHTDDQGGFDANMALSRERAEAVKATLVEQHGVAPGRLRTMGLGSTRPVAGNDTAEGRRQNRRVELVRQ